MLERMAGVVVLILLAAGCTRRGPQRKVRIVVSVDWEGAHLHGEDLDAMVAFRDAFLDVRLTHLLNAAYFLKDGADAGAVAAKIRSVIRPGDETGLHVHPWRSLVEAAGVAFREGPTFLGERYPLGEIDGDIGHEVELGAYDVAEIRAIVRESKRILAEADFKLSGSFRAGGWMGSDRVLEAIRAEGFLVDSSAIDSKWLDELERFRICRRIRRLWPDVTEATGPFVVRTRAGPVIEMPDTCSLADYVTAKEMAGHVERAVRRLAADPTRDVFCHFGFHQETAEEFVGRVADAIRAINSRHGPSVGFETLTESANRARATATAGE